MTVLRRRGHPLLNDSPPAGAPVRQRSHLEGSLPLKFCERVAKLLRARRPVMFLCAAYSRDFATVAPGDDEARAADRQASTNVGAAAGVPARRR
jgi:hypothetical protein